MMDYLDILGDVLKNGNDRPNRTGVDTRSKFGVHLSFDLSEGFPATTTKKLAFKQVVGELLGFLRGYDNAADFRKLGCTIWDANASAPYWQSNASCKGPDDLGRIYGVQWRDWKTHKPLLGNPIQGRYEGDPQIGGFYIEGYKPFDQLADVLARMKKDPYDRRLVVSAWNAWEIANQEMALPPCHVMFQLYPNPADGTLSLSMYQRSADLFLGVPFNIASYALLTHILAQLSGYKPGRLEMFLGDAHIYHNHFEQVETQLRRVPRELPTLVMTPRARLEDFEPGDFHLLNYVSYPPIKGEMAV